LADFEVVCSKEMEKYFTELDSNTKKCYDIATIARKKGFDPEDYVEIKLAKNMAERVVGIIAVVAPQIINSGVVERIVELEKKYESLDWRIAFIIAHEIAQQKFCSFKDEKEAIEVGIRTGFCYVTVGVVSSPLEGLTSIDILPRRDGTGNYFRLNYSGPIRNAGGTGASVSVLIADYVRKKMGYAKYDPDENEIKRCSAELEDYHQYVANLQYYPYKEEVDFLMRHIPVEIGGEPSEKREISNASLKDLPRIETNLLRSGYCLIHSSCIPLKSPKLWKNLSKWGHEFDMHDWDFLEKHIKLQKELKSTKTETKTETKDVEERIPTIPGLLISKKIKTDSVFITDLVGGRPVLGHPMRSGSFRLRYGRSRTSGYSGQSTHPATLGVMNDMIAIGTQLKVERPGKASLFTSCDNLMGPTVKLKDGSVVYIDSFEEAKKLSPEVEEIIYNGDALIAYGDFFDRAHILIPPGYVEEYWILEVKEALKMHVGEFNLELYSKYLELPQEFLEKLFFNSITTKVSFDTAENISQKLNVPLHPAQIYFYKEIDLDQFRSLVQWFIHAQFQLEFPRITLPYGEEYVNAKRALELLGVPHKLENGYVHILSDHALALTKTLNIFSSLEAKDYLELIEENKELYPLEIINKFSNFKIKDKSGIFIGARMGRPEKCKMRKMKGNPHGLFPVGEDGGRLRSFQSAFDTEKITSSFPVYICPKCKNKTPLRICEMCETKTIRQKIERATGEEISPALAEQMTDKVFVDYKEWSVPINSIFEYCLKKINTKIYPDLIKGVRGMVGKDKSVEHPIKALLRAKNGICVNKDGTIRYDSSEVTLTHFKPKEIGVSIEKLKKLGYLKDIYNKPLENNNQILELKVQDVVMPIGVGSPEEGSDQIFLRTSQFIDDLLVYVYGLEPFYKAKTADDLIGQLIVGLAPHTSAGSIGRLIGWTKSQGMMAHPMYHAAMRRDCFSYDSRIPVKINGRWEIIKIGELVENLNPSKIVDAFSTKEIKVKNYITLGLKNNKIVEVNINNFTKHTPQKMIGFKTKLGRTIKTTFNHKHLVFENNKTQIKQAYELKKGSILKIPYNYNISQKNVTKLNLLELFKTKPYVMVRGLKQQIKDLRKQLKLFKLNKMDVNNFFTRDCIPINVAYKLINSNKNIDKKELFLSVKRDSVKLPLEIKVDEAFLKIIGLYIAEGYCRKKIEGKGYYQIYIAAQKEEIRTYIKKYFKLNLNLTPTENKDDRVTFSSRILYELFADVLKLGSTAYEKRIPSQFLALPEQKLGHLLSGYFEGDGSVSKTDLRISFDTVSTGLMRDIEFVLGRMHTFVKYKEYVSKPGKQVADFYIRKNVPVQSFKVIKGTIQSKFIHQISKYIKFISKIKEEKFQYILKNKKHRNLFVDFDDDYLYDEIIEVKEGIPETSYCLNVENNTVIVDGILTKQCDGDESCAFLVLDAFLNFSQKFLGTSRGSTMDAPLVLTSILNPSEVDDMAFKMDIADHYPLEFYRACEEFKYPWDVKIKQISSILGTPEQFEGMMFTHDLDDMNEGVLCSSYKTLPSMAEKIECQMDLAKKIRAVDTSDVARLVIEKHFIRDTRGNLRKFSLQQFRCGKCNTKYRRPPLIGKCTNCGGKIIFTISEGSIIKYLDMSLDLAYTYNVSDYLKESLELIKKRILHVFGKEKEKQTDLDSFYT